MNKHIAGSELGPPKGPPGPWRAPRKTHPGPEVEAAVLGRAGSRELTAGGGEPPHPAVYTTAAPTPTPTS